ncbi:MBL fold metallo-hydrolase [Sinorhizobium garamanticum]|uniref:MBL fold metallo-hydrolase n=1 Tax=Sinorhizobium garamanticum TaxID=680247 RepID=A0ABY8DKG2_9HYPH|nr:MBL fold metallo-hydrolase [Sinorhizobium garamanticum]WEX90025.1 MBL fold metallo-hydrolase [Sinorhizobium garamanticum]
MDLVVPGLYASSPEPLSFAPETTIRAFLLQRATGNLLIYNVGTLAADQESVRRLGGISRRYLNHWHEAGMGCSAIAETFGAPLVSHELERHHVSEKCRVDDTFSDRHMVDRDFEVIPTPGHTEGATAYLWDNGKHRFLFTGDTVYLDDGNWRAAVLESNDRDAYIATLESIKQLEFDVLVPWAASIDQPYITHTNSQDTRARIDAILERVRSGSDH